MEQEGIHYPELTYNSLVRPSFGQSNLSSWGKAEALVPMGHPSVYLQGGTSATADFLALFALSSPFTPASGTRIWP